MIEDRKMTVDDQEVIFEDLHKSMMDHDSLNASKKPLAALNKPLLKFLD